jgi:hypothetical protein
VAGYASVLIANERRRFAVNKFLAANPDEGCLLSAITVSELLHQVERATAPERKTQRHSIRYAQSANSP